MLHDQNGKKLEGMFVKAKDAERVARDYEFEFDGYVCSRDSYDGEEAPPECSIAPQVARNFRVVKFKSPMNVGNSFKTASELLPKKSLDESNDLVKRLFQKRGHTPASDQDSGPHQSIQVSKWPEFVGEEEGGRKSDEDESEFTSADQEEGWDGGPWPTRSQNWGRSGRSGKRLRRTAPDLPMSEAHDKSADVENVRNYAGDGCLDTKGILDLLDGK